MAFKLAHILSTSGLQPAPLVPWPVRPELIVKDGTDSQASGLDGGEPDGMAAQTARRTRIWEFGTNLHCSIIGTCLSTAELRQVLDKLKMSGAAIASDHELHSVGVMLAGRREGGAKFLQKALDRRQRSAIARCARAKKTADLLALWEESLKQGDIPGAYWAVLTHPVTTEAVVKRVFGDVHMLSHLVGAAIRADIRRLRQLEQENAALLIKIERQQRQLRDGFAVRDQSIRRLNEMLARQDNEQPDQSDLAEKSDDIETADNLIRDLQRRLAREIVRGDRMERRFNEASASSRAKDRTLQRLKEELEATRHELALVESHLDEVVAQPRPAPEVVLNLSGITLLYVGGRANQIPRLKALVERAGARFLHHDGGLEQNAGLLPNLVSRADHVTFPVDCVSHDAVLTIKRLCRQTGRSYQPLRSASLACLLSVLPAISRPSSERVTPT